MAKRSCPRLVLTILVALVVAMGFVLPGHAQMPCRHDHPGNAIGMPSTVMGHHHGMRTAGSGASEPGGACGQSCPACAMTCCGVILPDMVPVPLGVAPPHVVFAAEPRLGHGVLGTLDPYPPRRIAQS